MAQSFDRHNHTPQRFTAENAAVSVAQTGNTTLLDMVVEGAEKMSVVVANTVQALDTFVVQVQFHRNAAYVTLFSAAGDFTAPAGRMLGASGDLTTLGVATGWFEMDVSGLYAIRILASGSNATASVTSIYATGGSAGQSNSNISLTGADTVTLAAGSALAGKVGIDQTTPGATNKVIAGGAGTALAPSAEVLTTQRPAVTQVISTALEASHVLKASAGQLVQLSVFSSKTSAQWILVLNSATLTADGAVTLLFPPIPILPNSLLVLDLPAPVVASNGITVCNSSTGGFTKTIGSADCAFYAQVN